MTEDDAKTRWCPFARVRNISFDSTETTEAWDEGANDIGLLHTDSELDSPIHRVHITPFAGPAANRINFQGETKAEEVIHSGSLCIGSACMAWRFGIKRNPDWKPVHQMMTGYSQHPDDVEQPWIKDIENGHCGLAGKP